MLEARSISKKLGDVQVLKSIDLRIDQGDLAIVMGPSGAGKTTLLHILGTLETPDQGSLLFEGQPVHQWNARQLARFRNQQLGFVFQFHNLLGELTALENAALPAMIAGKTTVEAQRAAREHLVYLGLEHRLKHRPHELSGGEQQRVAMARALVNDPVLVLADEPSGNLDSKHAEELHHLMARLNRERKQTFVVVTHNHELRALGTRHIDMVDGALVQGATEPKA